MFSFQLFIFILTKGWEKDWFWTCNGFERELFLQAQGQTPKFSSNKTIVNDFERVSMSCGMVLETPQFHPGEPSCPCGSTSCANSPCCSWQFSNTWHKFIQPKYALAFSYLLPGLVYSWLYLCMELTVIITTKTWKNGSAVSGKRSPEIMSGKCQGKYAKILQNWSCSSSYSVQMSFYISCLKT